MKSQIPSTKSQLPRNPKSQAPNPKRFIDELQASRCAVVVENADMPYDLKDRTYRFARDMRVLLRRSPWNPLNVDDFRQAIRSSGSIAANYLEADESLSRKDFVLRIKICRKEARETLLWLKLLGETTDVQSENLDRLSIECDELVRILNSIVRKFVPS